MDELILLSFKVNKCNTILLLGNCCRFPTDLSDVSKFPTLFDKLGETWSESDLKKLAGENMMRVLKAVEQVNVIQYCFIA